MLNYALKQLKPVLKLLENQYVMGSVTLFIVLYGALVKPELPNFLKVLMKNDIFRLFYIFLIAYIGNKNLVVSIVIAFIFIVLFGLLNELELQETFENIENISENLDSELNKLLDELDTAVDGSEEAEIAGGVSSEME